MKMQTKIIGEGKPLVLVPGGLTGWISWEPHAERVSSKRKVVRVQLLNVEYGLEDKPLPQGYSVKTESRALGEAIEELNLEKPFDVAAWSYGAEVTLDYALDNPENIRTLVLIEPPAFWVIRANGKIDTGAENIINMLETLNGDITEENLEQFLSSVGFLKPGQSARELPQWESWSKFRNSLRNSPAAVDHDDDVSRLKDFNKPVLLLKGTGSAKFLHQISDALSEYFPDVRTAEMPEGHAPHIVSMDRFLKEMEEFQIISSGGDLINF